MAYAFLCVLHASPTAASQQLWSRDIDAHTSANPRLQSKRVRVSMGLTERTQQSFHLQAPPPSGIRPPSRAPRPLEQRMSPQIHEWPGAPAWLETHIILVSPSNKCPKRAEAAPKYTLEMRGLPAQSQLLPVVSGTGEYSDRDRGRGSRDGRQP